MYVCMQPHSMYATSQYECNLTVYMNLTVCMQPHSMYATSQYECNLTVCMQPHSMYATSQYRFRNFTSYFVILITSFNPG